MDNICDLENKGWALRITNLFSSSIVCCETYGILFSAGQRTGQWSWKLLISLPLTQGHLLLLNTERKGVFLNICGPSHTCIHMQVHSKRQMYPFPVTAFSSSSESQNLPVRPFWSFSILPPSQGPELFSLRKKIAVQIHCVTILFLSESHHC